MSRWLLVLLALFVFNPAAAHDGAVDFTGCHPESIIWKPGYDRYHCHQGPFAGQTFDSASELFGAWLELENPSFSGPATVIDGDTLEVNGKRVRLFGLDAPEMDQRCEWPSKVISCGKRAKTAMQSILAGGGDVTCYPNDDTIEKDDGEHAVAICVASGGFDIGLKLVYAGWAVTPEEHRTRYKEEETDARQAKRGMWRGEFVLPRDWRRGER